MNEEVLRSQANIIASSVHSHLKRMGYPITVEEINNIAEFLSNYLIEHNVRVVSINEPEKEN